MHDSGVTCGPHISDAFCSVHVNSCMYVLLCKGKGTVTIILKILGVTVQNLVAWVTRCLEILPAWSAVNKTGPSYLKCEN
jgi:hypothetical protein